MANNKSFQRKWEEIWSYELENPKVFGESEFSKNIVKKKLMPKGARILSLGTGYGYDEIYFAKQGYKVIATDFSEIAVKHINRKASEAGLTDKLIAELQDMSEPFNFKGESFDVVYSHFSLYYFDDEERGKIIKEIQRVLKRDGKIFIAVRSTKDWKYGKGVPLGKDLVLDHRGLKRRFFSEESLRPLFEKKFKILKITEKKIERYGEPTSIILEMYAQKI